MAVVLFLQDLVHHQQHNRVEMSAGEKEKTKAIRRKMRALSQCQFVLRS